MTASIIDGKALARDLRQSIATQVERRLAGGRERPGLAVLLVGKDPASEVYVASKLKASRGSGFRSMEFRFSDDIAEEALLAFIRGLNCDPTVDGILVQLPLPKHINVQAVLEAIDPAKDVDGFHPLNVGRVATGGEGMVPCTPLGCLQLLKSVHPDLTGMNAVVVGASNIVGRPMSRLLEAEKATVTLAHIATRNVRALSRTADLLVVATGSPRLIRGDWVKPGATVIDVGISRVPCPGGTGTRLVGDVAFEEAVAVAGAITPVPGGVGPMTIACLLANTLKAASQRDDALA